MNGKLDFGLKLSFENKYDAALDKNKWKVSLDFSNKTKLTDFECNYT